MLTKENLIYYDSNHVMNSIIDFIRQKVKLYTFIKIINSKELRLN